jgi:hypothetical protein
MMTQKHLSLSDSLRPKELASQLLREVVEHNYSIRDYFKDWKLAIDEALKGEAQLYHLSHIIAMENLAMLAAEILRRAMQVLGHLTEGWTSVNLAEDAAHHDSIVLGAGTATQAPPPLTRLPSDAIGLLSPAATARALTGAPPPIGGATSKQPPVTNVVVDHIGVLVSGGDTSASSGRTPLERVASMASDRGGGIAQRGLSGIGGSMNIPVVGLGGVITTGSITGGAHHHGHTGSSISGRRAGVANATHWAIQQSSVTRAQRAHLQARAFLYNYAHQYREVQEHLVKLVQVYLNESITFVLMLNPYCLLDDSVGICVHT